MCPWLFWVVGLCIRPVGSPSHTDGQPGSSGSSIPGGVLAGGSGGQIYGLFVGVADYPGSDSDLPLTDQDAQRARDALIQGAGMNPGNAYTLLNGDATRANFSNAPDGGRAWHQIFALHG